MLQPLRMIAGANLFVFLVHAEKKKMEIVMTYVKILDFVNERYYELETFSLRLYALFDNFKSFSLT